MKTRYEFVDKEGNVTYPTPFEDMKAKVVGIRYSPDNTPGLVDADEMIILLEIELGTY